MSNKIWIIGCCAVSFVAWGTWTVFRSATSAPKARSSAVAARGVPKAATAEAAFAFAPRPAPSVAVVPSKKTEAASERDSPEPPPVTGRPESLNDYASMLDVIHQQDTRDRKWEIGAEQRLKGLFDTIQVPGARVASMDCRASLCKVVVDNADLETMERSHLELSHSYAWTGPVLRVREEPDSPTNFRMILFFGREGRDMPGS